MYLQDTGFFTVMLVDPEFKRAVSEDRIGDKQIQLQRTGASAAVQGTEKAG